MLPVLKIQNFFDLQNDLVEIRLYAERKAGEIIKNTELNKGGRPNENQSSHSTGLKLKDMGITRDQSSNWQRIAGIPEEIFFNSQLIIFKEKNSVKMAIPVVPNAKKRQRIIVPNLEKDIFNQFFYQRKIQKI